MNIKDLNVIDASAPWKLPSDDDVESLANYSMLNIEWAALLEKAENGDPEAQWEVADRYHEGCFDETGKTLVVKSPQTAAEWFQRSAEAGYAPAQNNLGIMLGDGDGLDKNFHLALIWLKKAYKAGDPSALKNIAITYRENGNYRRAVHWFRKCAAKGDDEAILQLGIHSYWGKGVKKDFLVAVQCFQKAIKSKNITAAGKDNAYFYLALAYLEGKGVAKSVPITIKLLRRANIDNDHSAACELLEVLQSTKASHRATS